MWISFAKKNDIPAIIEMEKECFADKAWTKDMVENDFEKRSLYIIAKKEDDEYIGYLSILDLEDECEILRLGVRKKYRKQGYAKSMLDFIIEYCIENKKEKIYLEVNSANTVAIKLYELEGFTCINVRKNYYGQGEDAKIYVKLL